MRGASTATSSPTPAALVAAFLLTARRRLILGSILAAAFAAAVINEAIRWGAVAAMKVAKRQLPVLDVGLFLVPILVVAAYRRWTPAAAARRADARLDLRDRLVSFVDFARRAGIPAAVREAQARETKLALAGLRAATAAPIPAWLAAGPLLLLASLAYPYFLGTGPVTTTVIVLRQLRTGFERGGDQERSPTAAGGGNRPAGPGEETVKKGGTPPPGVEQEPPAKEEEDAAARPPTEAGANLAAKQLDEQGGEGGSPEPKDETENPRAPDHGNAVETEQLVSEQVGRALTKVVDPVYNPAAENEQPVEAAGNVTVDLVPRNRLGTAAGTPEEGSTSRRITVDLDALPEQYRPLVKTYFELLAAGGQDGDTPTTRSGEP